MVAVGEGGEGVISSSQIDPQLMTDVWLLVDQSCVGEDVTPSSLLLGPPKETSTFLNKWRPEEQVTD